MLKWWFFSWLHATFFADQRIVNLKNATNFLDGRIPMDLRFKIIMPPATHDTTTASEVRAGLNIGIANVDARREAQTSPRLGQGSPLTTQSWTVAPGSNIPVSLPVMVMMDGRPQAPHADVSIVVSHDQKDDIFIGTRMIVHTNLPTSSLEVTDTDIPVTIKNKIRKLHPEPSNFRFPCM